jgi:hypothetical protein
MIYRKASAVVRSEGVNGHTKGIEEALEGLEVEGENGEKVVSDVDKEGDGEAAQCIWLARIRPEDCENVVRYTVLQGKVVKPDRQLRGGFDRCKQVVSW